MNHIAELLQERAGLIKAMRTTLDTADAEKRALTAEERQEQERQEARIGEIDLDVESRKKLRELERTLEGDNGGDLDGRKLNGDGGDDREARTAEYNSVFDRYLRHGAGELTVEERQVLRTGYAEQRDQAKGTGAAGGFLVPTSFEKTLFAHLVDAGAMRQTRVTILQTASGEDIQLPKTTAHGAAALVAENAAVAAADETFGQVTLQAFTYARLIKVPLGLLEDSAIDLEAYLGKELGRSIGALQNTHFVNGDGAAKPQGIVGVSTLGKTGAAGQVTTVTTDDLMDLFYAVIPPYRRSGEWAANDSTLKAIRKLKDADNQYIWQPGLVGDEPDRLLGRPFHSDPDVPAMAASAKSIIFGDFSAYVIRDVRGIAVRRLEERFADNLQVGFIGWMRADGDLVDQTGAVKHYANAAV